MVKIDVAKISSCLLHCVKCCLIDMAVKKHSPSVPGSLGALLSPCFNAFGDLSDCLGGGCKDCLFSPLLGEDSHFD